MYLAEDRIMCLFIVIQRLGTGYKIKWLPGSKALTDPPADLPTLIKQRRRWGNGSIMASIYIIKKFGSLCRSNQSVMYKGFLVFYWAILLI
jgi:chitin synthase